jgi:hypothetical protein
MIPYRSRNNLHLFPVIADYIQTLSVDFIFFSIWNVMASLTGIPVFLHAGMMVAESVIRYKLLNHKDEQFLFSVPLSSQPSP